MINLLIEDGCVLFSLEVVKLDGSFIEFRVYEICSWSMGGDPIDSELYLTGSIKWDGCSHIWFGEEDCKGNQDGYLHLCGELFWDRHCKLMKKLYIYAKENIKGYNPSIAS